VRSRQDYYYELSSTLFPTRTRMSSYNGCDNNRVNDDVVDRSLRNRPKRLHPNRRHVSNGLYLPGVVCEGVGEICIAVDCSGFVTFTTFCSEAPAVWLRPKPAWDGKLQQVNVTPCFPTMVISGMLASVSLPSTGGGTTIGFQALTFTSRRRIIRSTEI
jgi:hypothetical protein